jgi:hypothetical protein
MLYWAKSLFKKRFCRYCNVDDKVLVGKDSVKQKWKRSDRCYAITQYTHVNNGDENIFCVVGEVVTSRV